MRKSIFFAAVVFGIVLITFAGYAVYENWKISMTKIPPKAPVNLTAKPITATTMELTWKDTSRNENGFVIYRDGIVTANLSENAKKYVDVALRPATNYKYQIEAYNQAGKSDIVTALVRTLNPPIVVWIDQIGVHDNGEDLLRDLDGGEINVGVVITDGKTTTQIRLPNEGYYHLKDDGVTDVKFRVFSTAEVGDYLRVAAIGYENDGGSGEQLLYKVMDIATKSYIGGPASKLLTLSGIDFTSIFSQLFGAEDDWLGTYVSAWQNDSNWGVGRYIDIESKNKDGKVGLRLWFRVECPVYDYSLEKSIK